MPGTPEPDDLNWLWRIVVLILKGLLDAGFKESANFVVCILFGFACLAMGAWLEDSSWAQAEILKWAAYVVGGLLVAGGVVFWLWFLSHFARRDRNRRT